MTHKRREISQIMGPSLGQIQVSVIIPSGRPEMVLQTLEALKRQGGGSLSYEVLLVTPFSADAKGLGSELIRVIEVEELYPPGRMRNIGAAEAKGEYLAFIDDDCVPPPHWLRQMQKKLEGSVNTAAVGCRVVCGVKTFMNRCADHCLFGAYQYHISQKIALGSAALVVRRQAFEAVAGFDEELLASEDWDFSLRFQKLGWSCFFDAEITVRHSHGRGSVGAIIRCSYLYGYRSGLVVQARHRSSLSWLARLALFLGTAGRYWPLIIPYALALTFMQGKSIFHHEPSALPFIPMIFLSRLAYQVGVWRCLCHDQNDSQGSPQ